MPDQQASAFCRLPAWDSAVVDDIASSAPQLRVVATWQLLGISFQVDVRFWLCGRCRLHGTAISLYLLASRVFFKCMGARQACRMETDPSELTELVRMNDHRARPC